jgi:hypothetical protein
MPVLAGDQALTGTNRMALLFRESREPTCDQETCDQDDCKYLYLAAYMMS